jgi:colanic acid/amylovoran biosynthesis glycosyltransferase
MAEVAFIFRSLNLKSEIFLINVMYVLTQRHNIHVYYEKADRIVLDELLKIKGVNTASPLTLVNSFKCMFKKPLKVLNIFILLDVPKKRKFLDLPILLNSSITHLYFPFGYNTIFREEYGQFMGIKSLVSFRGSDILIWPKQKNYDYRPLLNKIGNIHCNSSIIQKEVVKIESSAYAKTQVIPSGLREEFEKEFDFREIINLRKQAYAARGEQIITIGRLNWIKGYESILQSLASLKHSKRFVYHVVGYGEDEHKLKTMVEKLDLADVVVFHGYQNTEEIIQLLKESTLYIQTSWSEGFSNSVLEAQAMGLFTIVTPVSGMIDILDDPTKGIILENFQNDTLIERLNDTFTEEHFESRMNQTLNLRTSCINTFGFKTFEKNWLAFFESVA